ncbi:MAG: TAXI family TRAP transporter solute-binding subunit [Clostridia bacterium]|nr:TAXI family TRAP transporter solute-binding subunit [Clostridia bacterium]
MKRNITRLIACCMLIAMLAGSPVSAAMRFVTISTGPVGGEWYVLGGILSELLKEPLAGIKVTATTGGSVANLSTVASGKSDIATTQDQLLFEARNGTGDFAGQGSYDNVMGLAYLGDIYMSVFLVREDMQINSLDDIKTKKLPIKILTAPTGSSPSKAAERMLAEYGVTPESLKSWGGSINYVSYSDASSLISDGHADAYCGPIMPAIVELSVSRKVKMLPVKLQVLDQMTGKYKYGRSVIPKNAYYFVKADTPVMTESPILIVRADLPEDIVYTITKAICTNPERIRESGKTYAGFAPRITANIAGGPIHPGALRYYKEQGWMK